eukprot:g2795.t1
MAEIWVNDDASGQGHDDKETQVLINGRESYSTGGIIFLYEKDDEYNMRKIVVRGRDDKVQDGKSTTLVEVKSRITYKHGASTNTTMAKSAFIRVVNHDDDTAGLHISLPVNATTGADIPIATDEAGEMERTFSVRLTSQPANNADVVVPIEVIMTNLRQEASVFTRSCGKGENCALTFTSANWNESQTVYVVGNDDNIQDGTQAYNISVGPAKSCDALYGGTLTGLSCNGENGWSQQKIGNTECCVSSESTQGLTKFIGATNSDDDFIGLSIRRVVEADNTDETLWNTLQAAEKTRWGNSIADWRAGQDMLWNAIPAQDRRRRWEDRGLGFDDWRTWYMSDQVWQAMNITGQHQWKFNAEPFGNGKPNFNAWRAVYDSQRAGGNTTEDGRTQTQRLRLKLTSEPLHPVLFTVGASNPNEGKAEPSIMSFSPKAWHIEQVITIAGVDDPYLDGAKDYTIKIVQLYTEDPLYSKAAAVEGIGFLEVPFRNLDEAHDRSKKECSLGRYGSTVVDDPAYPCKASGQAECKACNSIAVAEEVISKWESKYTRERRLATTRARGTRAEENKSYSCASFGATFPLTANYSHFPDEPDHSWDILAEPVYESTWKIAGMEFHMTESSLQFYFLLATFCFVMGIAVACQFINFCSKAQLMGTNVWVEIKTNIKDLDAFEDQHMRHIGEKKTLVGGFSTIMFQVLSWALVSVVCFIFAYYNSGIGQSLLPRTEEMAEVRTNFVVETLLFGYTGSCPCSAGLRKCETMYSKNALNDVIAVAGVECNGVERVIFDCSPGYLRLRWTGDGCDVSTATVSFTLGSAETGDIHNKHAASARRAVTKHAVSAQAIRWFVRAGEVLPNENNSVTGWNTPPLSNGSAQVFRGENPVDVNVELIAAKYDNSMNQQERRSYRLQYMSDSTAPASIAPNDFTAFNTPDKLQINIHLIPSIMMLMTQIEAKQTWIDVWSLVGGLFASIGGTIVVGMNFFEWILKICGCGKRMSLTARSENDDTDKKKGKGKSAAPSATTISTAPTPESGIKMPEALIENPTAKPKRRKSRMSVAGTLAEERRLELQKLKDGPEAEVGKDADASAKMRRRKKHMKKRGSEASDASSSQGRKVRRNGESKASDAASDDGSESSRDRRKRRGSKASDAASDDGSESSRDRRKRRGSKASDAASNDGQGKVHGRKKRGSEASNASDALDAPREGRVHKRRDSGASDVSGVSDTSRGGRARKKRDSETSDVTGLSGIDRDRRKRDNRDSKASNITGMSDADINGRDREGRDRKKRDSEVSDVSGLPESDRRGRAGKRRGSEPLGHDATATADRDRRDRRKRDSEASDASVIPDTDRSRRDRVRHGGEASDASGIPNTDRGRGDRARHGGEASDATATSIVDRARLEHRRRGSEALDVV